jgi:hypothetical protein
LTTLVVFAPSFEQEGTVVRKVFYSFHYALDNERTAAVRDISTVEGSQAASESEWEKVAAGGDDAIKAWIDEQTAGTSCQVVLIGSETAERKWVNYEIGKAWKDGLGVVGVYVHNIPDEHGAQSAKGYNPFKPFSVKGRLLSEIVKAYDPPSFDGEYVRGYITENLAEWVEEAMKIREQR